MVTPGPRISVTRACTAGVNSSQAMRATRLWPSPPHPNADTHPHSRIAANLRIRSERITKHRGAYFGTEPRASASGLLQHAVPPLANTRGSVPVSRTLFPADPAPAAADETHQVERFGSRKFGFDARERLFQLEARAVQKLIGA